MKVQYRVQHKTLYGYSTLVSLSHHLARLRPRQTRFQNVQSSSIMMTPEPSTFLEGKDAYDNNTTFLITETPHNEMRLLSEFMVEVKKPDYPQSSNTLSWERAASFFSTPQTTQLIEACEMTAPSCFIPLTPEIKDYAAPSFIKERPILEVAEEIMQRIYHDFTYDAFATSIATPINESLSMKRGVCQDFAHVAIACLRSFGLAARYVSGYILTKRESQSEQTGEIDMIGGDASHAWFSVFVPDYGWVDLDPTNNMFLNLEHITVGWGRDFDDMSPIKGLMMGGGSHTISVDVCVQRLSSSYP